MHAATTFFLQPLRNFIIYASLHTIYLLSNDFRAVLSTIDLWTAGLFEK